MKNSRQHRSNGFYLEIVEHAEIQQRERAEIPDRGKQKVIPQRQWDKLLFWLVCFKDANIQSQ